MAAFRFSLMTLLKIKEQFEQNAENELGLAVQAHEHAKAALAAAVQDIADMSEEFRASLTGRIEHGRIEAIRRWLDTLELRRAARERDVLKAAGEVEAARAKLVELMKERKVLEKLKEKEFQRFMAEEAASEQKQIDELVTYKARTRSGDE